MWSKMCVPKVIPLSGFYSVILFIMINDKKYWILIGLLNALHCIAINLFLSVDPNLSSFFVIHHRRHHSVNNFTPALIDFFSFSCFHFTMRRALFGVKDVLPHPDSRSLGLIDYDWRGPKQTNCLKKSRTILFFKKFLKISLFSIIVSIPWGCCLQFIGF